MPNVPYPYEVNWQIGHRKWFLNINLFLIKEFLIAKFDCTMQCSSLRPSYKSCPTIAEFQLKSVHFKTELRDLKMNVL